MEKYLVEHCSPTLASLKTANLFSYSYSSLEEVDAYVSFWNQCMAEKGVNLCVLRIRGNTALIYVYRKELLKKDMERPGVKCFLKSLGYDSIDVDCVVSRLKERLKNSQDFPHEIGLFLGYPLGDVVGFVENSGRNCICAGCWKVYCNESEAMRTFQKFKKCTAIYRRLWSQGRRSVLQLTVAA
ncbi:MAG: DUF3793 family protein [Eubacteriales bacterium]|nr:DUF3793 family protein [Eubacteriales bacterium]